MGTRSLTIVKESIDTSCEDIIVMYKQFDGYPEGMGVKLANFLKGYKIINGISAISDELKDKKFNYYAKIISKKLNFEGAWFFQMKKDYNNRLKLLKEVMPKYLDEFNVKRMLQYYGLKNVEHLDLIYDKVNQTYRII